MLHLFLGLGAELTSRTEAAQQIVTTMRNMSYYQEYHGSTVKPDFSLVETSNVNTENSDTMLFYNNHWILSRHYAEAEPETFV